jgi:hypothetical protein
MTFRVGDKVSYVGETTPCLRGIYLEVTYVSSFAIEVRTSEGYHYTVRPQNLILVDSSTQKTIECADCGKEYAEGEMLGSCPALGHQSICNPLTKAKWKAPAPVPQAVHTCGCEMIDLMKQGCTCGAIARYDGGLKA